MVFEQYCTNLTYQYGFVHYNRSTMNTFSRFLVYGFSIALLFFAGPACNPDDPSNLGPSDSQQIFGEWRESELIRSGCTDANNNYRRPCDDCNILSLDTEYSFRLSNDDELLVIGTYRVVNDTDISFDPSIFDTEGVSSVRYDLIKGAMKFSYTDRNTGCAVIESYLVNTTVGGDG